MTRKPKNTAKTFPIKPKPGDYICYAYKDCPFKMPVRVGILKKIATDRNNIEYTLNDVIYYSSLAKEMRVSKLHKIYSTEISLLSVISYKVYKWVKEWGS